MTYNVFSGTLNPTHFTSPIVLTNKLINKQTYAAENIHLAPLCYVGG